MSNMFYAGEWEPEKSTFLYNKWVINPDGTMFETEEPMECHLGFGGWSYLIWQPKCAVAWSNLAGNEPYNKFWEVMRDKARHPHLRGTLVLFRHHAHLESHDFCRNFHAKAPPPKRNFAKCLLL